MISGTEDLLHTKQQRLNDKDAVSDDENVKQLELSYSTSRNRNMADQ